MKVYKGIAKRCNAIVDPGVACGKPIAFRAIHRTPDERIAAQGYDAVEVGWCAKHKTHYETKIADGWEKSTRQQR